MGTFSDIVVYCSAGMPEDDSASSGGAIDLDNRALFTPLAVAATLEAVSSAAGDTTQQLTVEARKPDGTVSSQTVTLTGTTAVILSTLGSVETVLDVGLNADAAGSVTLRVSPNGATIGSIPVGERGFKCFMREASASQAQVETFYHKVFVRNNHGADTLNTASIALASDPSGRVTFALAAATGDSGSVASRKTSPGLTFDATEKAIPGGNLTAGEAIGVWLRTILLAGDSPYDTKYGLQVIGTW